MQSNEDVRFTFTLDSLPADTFRVVRLKGEESISSLFWFEVEVLSRNTDFDVRKLVSSTAHLGLSTFGVERTVHGVVEAMTIVRPVPGIGPVCRIRLVPRLWWLTRNRQYQIYGTTEAKSVVDILRAELTGERLSGPDAAAPCQFAIDDFALRLEGTYPARDHVVQYDETDFAFVSRHLEESGIFYFFDHAGGKDVAVFSDHNAAFADVADGFEISYDMTVGMVHDAPSIDGFEVTTRTLPQKVVLTDYNYRLPRVAQRGEAVVDPDGHGVVVDLGGAFRTPEEGAAQARIRAEALLCRQLTCDGTSDCVLFEAGRRFDLRGHPSVRFNGPRYLLETVRHEGWQPTELGDGKVDAGLPDEAGYRNCFTALKAEPAYRPEKRTPAPQMAGLMHGHIDGEGTGERAELDDQGRYRVRVPFDLSGNPDGEASGPVRMAQPYGGTRSGLHFPLTKGTEVVLGAIHGNPDRPVILGAVPNPSTASPVTKGSQIRNRLETNSGMLIELNDGAGSGADREVDGSTAPRHEEGPATAGGGDLWMKIDVPDYDGCGGRNYLRLGMPDGSCERGLADSLSGLDDTDGWLDYTDGNRASVTRSSKSERVSEDLTLQVGGNSTESISGNRSADVEENDILSVAADQDVTVGGARTLTVDGSETISTGARTETVTGTYTTTVAGDYTISVSGDSDEVVSGDASSWTTGMSTEGVLGIKVGIVVGLGVDLNFSLGIAINMISIEFNIIGAVEAGLLNYTKYVTDYSAPDVSIVDIKTRVEGLEVDVKRTMTCLGSHDMVVFS